MIRIGEVEIAERSIEYAVQFSDELIVDCEDLDEARQLAAAWKAPIIQRHWFATGWESIEETASDESQKVQP